MLYNLLYFSSKCVLFHNANLFGSCIIHILHTGVLKLKNNSAPKGLNNPVLIKWSSRLHKFPSRQQTTPITRIRGAISPLPLYIFMNRTQPTLRNKVIMKVTFQLCLRTFQVMCPV